MIHKEIMIIIVGIIYAEDCDFLPSIINLSQINAEIKVLN